MDNKHLCLGALAFDDASGYDIKKFFKNTLIPCFPARGYGSTYPALAELPAHKLLTATGVAGQQGVRRKLHHRVTVGRASFMCTPAQTPLLYKVKPDFLLALHTARLNRRSGGHYDARNF